jgi:hypothetical protein
MTKITLADMDPIITVNAEFTKLYIEYFTDTNATTRLIIKHIACRCSISFVIFRNSITSSKYIGYGLYFYLSGLSLRKVADSRLTDCFIKRNHVSNWNWIQK